MINDHDFDIFEGMTSISAVIKSLRDGSSNRRIVKILFDADRSKQKRNQRYGFDLDAI